MTASMRPHPKYNMTPASAMSPRTMKTTIDMQTSGRRAIVRTPPSKHCGIQEPGQSVRRRTHAFEEIVSLGDAAHRFENLSEAMIDFLADPLGSYADHQSMAAAEALHLNFGGRKNACRQQGATPNRTHRLAARGCTGRERRHPVNIESG